MPVIAVVNRKGGSGKSTLATNLAACFAQRGFGVLLGDLDRQPSTTAWLRRRTAHKLAAPPITGRSVDIRTALRSPPGVSHTVLDTPGGLHGLELARTLTVADLVLMPVCFSAFDRESATACFEELSRHPRVASGRCQVAAIGMRIDSRTRGAQSLGVWADAVGLPLIGVLRETQNYVRCIERGLALFDLPAPRVQTDLDQWRPILDWVDTALAARPPSFGFVPFAPDPSVVAPRRAPAPAQRASIEALARPAPAPHFTRLWEWMLPARLGLRRSR